jgi:thioredoxin 1
MEYTFTNENFEQEVLKSKQPVLIDFYADWCGSCRMMGPTVSALAAKYEGKLKVGRVNVDKQQDLAARYGVMSIPDFVVIKDGEIAGQFIGAMPKDVLESRLKAIL